MVISPWLPGNSRMRQLNSTNWRSCRISHFLWIPALLGIQSLVFLLLAIIVTANHAFSTYWFLYNSSHLLLRNSHPQLTDFLCFWALTFLSAWQNDASHTCQLHCVCPTTRLKQTNVILIYKAVPRARFFKIYNYKVRYQENLAKYCKVQIYLINRQF